jgi:chromosome segregation ATPase
MSNSASGQAFTLLNDKLIAVQNEVIFLKNLNGSEAEKRCTFSTKLMNIENALEENIKVIEDLKNEVTHQSKTISSQANTIQSLEHKINTFQPSSTTSSLNHLEDHLVKVEQDVESFLHRDIVHLQKQLLKQQQQEQEQQQKHEKVKENLKEMSKLKQDVNQLNNQHETIKGDILQLIQKHQNDMTKHKESIDSIKDETLTHLNLVKQQQQQHQQHNKINNLHETFKGEILQLIQKNEEDMTKDIAEQNLKHSSSINNEITTMRSLLEQQLKEEHIIFKSDMLEQIQNHQEDMKKKH